MRMTSGPLPPPETLARYEEVLPGLADRITRMAEGQSDHRKDMEKDALRGQMAGQTRGTYCGLAATGAVLAVAAYMARLGYPVEAAAVVTTNLAVLAGVFVIGRRRQGQDLEDHR